MTEGNLELVTGENRGPHRPQAVGSSPRLLGADDDARRAVLRHHSRQPLADDRQHRQCRGDRPSLRGLGGLPASAQQQIQGDSPEGQTGYALAVFLFAPVAVIVPLTISTAVGAATIVGERERGTGEFLAHSPASAREIYIGKLIASLIPGYLTVGVGFGLYSLIVNLTVGPSVGGWFFPTAQWWVMILWVLPPFLAICLSLVLRLSARVSSTAAAQQASGLVSLAPDHGRLQPGHRRSVRRRVPALSSVAWPGSAGLSACRGMRSVTRSRLLGVAAGI